MVNSLWNFLLSFSGSSPKNANVMAKKSAVGAHMRIAVGLILGTLLCGTPAKAQDAAIVNRIDGVAKFLVDRAHQNATYILQKKMANNQVLKCYLPQTHQSATSGNLDLLLQSGPEVWKRNIDQDLRTFGDHFILNNVSSVTINTVADDIADKLDQYFVDTLQHVRVRVDGKLYPVTSAPLTASPELRAALNDFADRYLLMKSKEAAAIAAIKAMKSVGSDGCPGTAFEEVISNLRDTVGAFQGLAKAQGVELVAEGSEAHLAAIDDSYADQLSSAAAIIASFDSRAKYYKQRIDGISRSTAAAAVIGQLSAIVQESINNHENQFISAVGQGEFDRFSRYALGLAMISDAKTSDQVKAVMGQLALPPSSFAVKRERGKDNFMVTAYFGGVGGVEFAHHSQGFGGLAVPMGVEYSKGTSKAGAVSLLLAPIDFGYPANQVINRQSGTATWRDILIPGAYLTYGVKDLPIVVGGGCSYGPAVTGTSGVNRGRCQVFLGTDMPLLGLF